MIENTDLSVLVEPTLTWYEANKRDLPWRKDKDPYHIWVSEIMLQQTRVEAVIPYYERFMTALPTIEALAKCQEDPLLKLWEGLGYYNRVRNMQKAAQTICAEYGGQMPQTYDGNVLRILSRVSQDDSDILKDATKKRMTAQLSQIMPKEAGAFNQALMEIGALVCIPNGQPKCDLCPWQPFCLAYKNDTYDRLPVKTKAKPRRIEEKTVLLIQDGQKIVLRKRPSKGLLAGLYELPNIEGYLTEEEALAFVRGQNLAPLQIKKLPEAKHIFSHIEWLMQGFLIQVADVDSFQQDEDLSKGPQDYLLVDIDKTRKEYAIPSAFDKYAEFIALHRMD